MIVKDIDMYLDGGTVKIETNEGTFYVDRRIKSQTIGTLYNDYPDKGDIVENGEEIKQKLYESLEGFEHKFYTNIESVREFIKSKEK